MSTFLVPKSSKKFICLDCDYSTSRSSQHERHVLTDKHLKRCLSTEINEKVPKSSDVFECLCGKSYKERSGLWRHKQKCSVEDTPLTKECSYKKPIEPSDKELILMVVQQNSELIKENSELKTMMMEVIKGGTTQNSYNTTNSHNKAFNLNFFLNETCKDAMNITDFVESIKLQLSDLEKVGELGYVEGISNIIVKNLKALDITERPVHCTDQKRETMYIRDENKWEKDEANSKIKKAIKRVASKNQRLLPKFKEAHPDCGTYHSKYSDQYNKIIIESVGGSGDNDVEKEEKIIRAISKNVLVEK